MQLRNGKILKRPHSTSQQTQLKKSKTHSTTAFLIESHNPHFASELVNSLSTTTHLPKPLIRLFLQYDGRSHNACFFNEIYSSLEEKILTLIYYAAPFEHLKFYIDEYKKKTNDVQLEHFLMDRVFTINGVEAELLYLPFINLDRTFNREKGMAEYLMNLLIEMFPHRGEEIIRRAKWAVSLNIIEKNQRREANVAAINKVFEAYKQNNNKMIAAEILEFEKYIQDIKKSFMNARGYLTNSHFNWALFHLIFYAYEVIGSRKQELSDPTLKKAFCFKIIAEILQSKLSPRMKQLFKAGLWSVLLKGLEETRQVDIDGIEFAGSGRDLLGKHFYYNVSGKSNCENENSLSHKNLMQAMEATIEQTLLTQIEWISTVALKV